MGYDEVDDEEEDEVQQVQVQEVQVQWLVQMLVRDSGDVRVGGVAA